MAGCAALLSNASSLAARAFWRLTAALTGLAVTLAALTAIDEPPDYTLFAGAGDQLLRGHLDQVYVRPGNQSGPLQLMAAALSRALLPRRMEVAGLRMAGAAALVLGFVFGVRQVRAWLGLRPAPLLLLTLGVVLVLWEVPGYGLDGHLAELAIPATWLAAAVTLRSGHPFLAAVLVGSAAAWEPWGVLGVAVLVLPTTDGPCAREWRGVIRRVVLATAVAVGSYLPFVLSGHFALLHYTWPVDDRSLWHLASPSLRTFDWWMRLIEAATVVVVGVAVAVALGRSRHALWLVPLAMTVARLLLDPIAYDYYLVTPQLIGLVGVGLLDREAVGQRIWVVLLSYLPFVVLAPVRLPVLAAALVLTGFLVGALRRPGSASGRAVEPAGR